ncbi:MAG TPA: FtsQ-type POTRA domain-containing protein, partial [Burkholderiaceae bacterium]|nr:FtsQ-type POTRA domain-containing protein [Burkholderiaceae bacterium]
MSANTMNRLARIFVALSVLLLGAAALFRLAQQPKFQLKRVEVRGDLRYVTATSVRTALAGRLRGNYFTMRLEDTRRMFETVPWVAAASVRRVWPD